MFDYTQNNPSLINAYHCNDYYQKYNQIISINTSQKSKSTIYRQNSIIDQLFQKNSNNTEIDQDKSIQNMCSIEQLIKNNSSQQKYFQNLLNGNHEIDAMLNNKNIAQSIQINSSIISNKHYPSKIQYTDLNYQQTNQLNRLLNIQNTQRIQTKIMIVSLPSKQDITCLPARPNIDKPFLRKKTKNIIQSNQVKTLKMINNKKDQLQRINDIKIQNNKLQKYLNILSSNSYQTRYLNVFEVQQFNNLINEQLKSRK